MRPAGARVPLVGTERVVARDDPIITRGSVGVTFLIATEQTYDADAEKSHLPGVASPIGGGRVLVLPE